MAVLKHCFCYSLRQGSFIIGSGSLILYCVAFAVELWWIVESLLLLPAPAYTLCALYFFNFLMAAVLLFGLLLRCRKYLMSWTLMTVLSFFPEAGMVLFMSLYYWPGSKYEYGLFELVYWSFRAIFNIFGAVCVCSLYLNWRDEEFILARLHDLTLSSVSPETPQNISIIGRHQGLNLNPLSWKALPQNYNNLGYYNAGYLQDGGKLRKSQISREGGRNGSLCASTVSRPRQANNAFRASLLEGRSVFDPSTLFDRRLRKEYISNLGIAGVGLEPPGQIPLYILPQKSGGRSYSLRDLNYAGGVGGGAELTRTASLGALYLATDECGQAQRGKNRSQMNLQGDLGEESYGYGQVQGHHHHHRGGYLRGAVSLGALHQKSFYGSNLLLGHGLSCRNNNGYWSESEIEEEEEPSPNYFTDIHL